MKPGIAIRRVGTATLLALALGASAPAAEEASPPPSQAKISFYRDIRPIFQASCHGCHQPAKAKGEYVMTTFQQLLEGGESKEKAIVPQQPDESQLVKLITPVDGEVEMPQKGDPLKPEQIARIRQWISEGAEDDTPPNARARYDMDHPPVYTRPPVITALDFSPDGQLLAVSGFHEVLLCAGDGSGLLGRLVGLAERIESVRFSPDGQKLAVTGGLPARMGEVQVWDTAKRTLLLSVPVTFDTVYGASWSPDGNTIAFGCADPSVRAIEAQTGKEILYQSAPEDWVFDTVFSTNGDHVIAVGRDMTAKLVELPTQRFIDNITSITPGALKGGLASVARHPTRDEILVGGSDGVPQIYRIFRQTKRVIGDNANLIRRFAPMKGRIFEVDYAPDGKRIATVSSLDGRGALHIYASDFDGALTEDLKKIFAKLVGEWSAEERKTIEDYQTKDIRLLASVELDSSVYTVAFTPDGQQIAVAGADGVVRFYDSQTASLRKAFMPAPLPADQLNSLAALSVEPVSVQLSSKFDYAQLLVQGWTSSGDPADLTRDATFHLSEEIATVTDRGVLYPKKNGRAQLRVQAGGKTTLVPVEVSGFDAQFEPNFILDVNPVISRMGCNQGTCHGAQDGKNGFKLSLRGYDPVFDVRAFSDDLAARRINFASPDDSLMLLKATAAVPHEGGQRTEVGSPYYQVLRDWIAAGCQLKLDTPRVASITLSPSNPVVQSLGASQQIRVVAEYADGRRRDVTTEAFIESGDSEIAKAEAAGLITTLRRGEAPILARFEGAYAATTLTVMGDRSGFVWNDPPIHNPIDTFVAAKWKRMRILPSELCADEEFLRRIHLDLTGLPPTSEATLAFLNDSRDSRVKREEVIDRLVGGDAYVDLWANKWADLLLVNRKFLGAEGAASFRGWITDQIRTNAPYDVFVRAILTSTGSNKDNPAASYYKILREPADMMENTTQLFLATRFNCNKCHDHPFERWTQDQYYQTAAFFARVGLKQDPASGDKRIGGTAVEGSKPLYEIIYDKDQGEVTHDRTGRVTDPAFPFPVRYEAQQGKSRREDLAAWITSPNNPYFARSYVNRVWGYLTGRGLIEPLDDIRAGNPPSNPDLLNWLTDQFIESGFDVQQLIRVICKSRTYQLSILSNRWNADDTINYSHATPRRLPAEVLFDAIYAVTGSKSHFPGVAEGLRASQLPDSGVNLPDGFLGNLGRPPRESACECERSNDIQLGPILSLITGPSVDHAISDPENAIAQLVQAEPDNRKVLRDLYLRILNRLPSEAEIDHALKILETIEPTHEQLMASLASYKEALTPLLAQREEQRQKDIGDAKTELESYQIELAPREEELDRKQKEAIAQADEKLMAYESAFAETAAKWKGSDDRKTVWIPFKPSELKAPEETTLALEDDLSVFASEKNQRGLYTLSGDSTLRGITGLKLEAIRDERLPKNGPGRAEDGNFVVTEFSVAAAPTSDPASSKPAPLENAKATFSQEGYNVKTAIDGQLGEEGNGWAVAPQMGRSHEAIFELKEPLFPDTDGRLTFTLNQKFRGGSHQLGRFRLWVTTTQKPIDFGVPEAIYNLLQIAADDRTEEQVQAVRDYFRTIDPELAKLQKELADAKQPRPRDAKLVALEEKLKRVNEPLPPDPKLQDLERAATLSQAQLEKRRLTAAQDVAWALINNPAFLFNH